MNEVLIQNIQTLLNYKDSLVGKKSAENIFKMLVDTFQLDVQQNKNIKTAHLSALSAYDSAHCITFPFRNQKILQATLNQLGQSNQEKKVLYIGTGPFAPFFLFPILLGYKAKFTLLEINEYALDILKQMIKHFNLDDYVIDIIQADATTWQIDQDYDIVLCETMDIGLQREDSFPIYKNLVPQLPNTIFIPKEVEILTGFDNEKPSLFDTLIQAVQRGHLKSNYPKLPNQRTFIQTRVIFDDDTIIEPNESVITGRLFLTT